MRRACIAMVVLLLGCASVATSPWSTGDDHGRTRAVKAAEDLAINPATGRPDLTRPSVARLMTYRAALAAMGGDISTAVGRSDAATRARCSRGTPCNRSRSSTGAVKPR